MEVGSVIDRGQLYRGLSQAAWGYFLLLLNFNLTCNNTISINLLPSFAGALLLPHAPNTKSIAHARTRHMILFILFAS